MSSSNKSNLPPQKPIIVQRQSDVIPSPFSKEASGPFTESVRNIEKERISLGIEARFGQDKELYERIKKWLEPTDLEILLYIREQLDEFYKSSKISISAPDELDSQFISSFILDRLAFALVFFCPFKHLEDFTLRVNVLLEELPDGSGLFSENAIQI